MATTINKSISSLESRKKAFKEAHLWGNPYGVESFDEILREQGDLFIKCTSFLLQDREVSDEVADYILSALIDLVES